MQDKLKDDNIEFYYGKLYDNNFSVYLDIWKAYISNKDKEKFCDAIFANLVVFSTNGRLNHSEIIKEFKDKFNKSIFDDRTFELAEYLYYTLWDDMTYQFRYSENKYIENVRKEIKGYKHNENILKSIHRIAQTILILGATSLPFILNFSDLQKSVPVTISIIVAILAALINYYKFGTRAAHFQQAAENMQYELSLYRSARMHYKNLSKGAAFDLFMDKIDELKHKRNELSLELERTAQEQDKKIDELLKEPAK